MNEKIKFGIRFSKNCLRWRNLKSLTQLEIEKLKKFFNVHGVKDSHGYSEDSTVMFCYDDKIRYYHFRTEKDNNGYLTDDSIEKCITFIDFVLENF